MADASTRPTIDGLVVVDKPSGWTSHDVVGRMRRLAGTRRVGHAGTLDPMATGVLILGIGRATRLLGYLAAHDKDYDATIRLGQRTVTDDAEGDVTGRASACAVTEADVLAAVPSFVGEIEQVPSAVSAIKVDGVRSYARVRAGEDVELPARHVTVSTFAVDGFRRPTEDLIDVDVSVTCSSGTYIRALARDLGEALGVGGHLTALRRTRIGGIDISEARTLDQLEAGLAVLPLADAVRSAFPARTVTGDDAAGVRHGRPLAHDGESGPTGIFDSEGEVLALMEPQGDELRVLVGFTGS
ncbi:MAG: tRNA pseudouridine(55) synthase TruB [Actinomycetia bacterium]|nr:tRNA pseudouridine(55) synthase TruB [Actinomycetes bacterium]